MAFQAPDGAASGRGLHLLEARDAVQLAFVALLQAQFADDVGASVIGQHLVIPVFHQLFLGAVDAADVADQVAPHLTRRVAAEQSCAHVHARKTEALGDETRDLLVTELGADRQRFEALALLLQAPEAAAVARRDLDHQVQAVDHRVELTDHFGRRELQRVSRVVGGQHHAIAVDDQTAVGHHWHHGNTVGFGLQREFLMAKDLQPDQSAHQQGEAEQHKQRRSDQPGVETFQFALKVLQLSHVET